MILNILYMSFICCLGLYGDSFLPTTDKLFVSKVEAKQSELKVVQERLKKLEEENEKKNKNSLQVEDDLKREIQGAKESSVSADGDFYVQKMVPLNDRYQVLKDTRQARERLEQVLKDIETILAESLHDPEMEQYKQELIPADRIAFSFDDLRQIKEKMDAKKASIDLLRQNEANTQAEIKSREQAASALINRYNEKREELEKSESSESEPFDLSIQQKRELINLEFSLLGSKKELDDLQLQILQSRLRFLRLKIDQELHQVRILQEIFVRIRQSSIHISDADVAFARDELEKKRRELNAKKFDYYEPKKEEIRRRVLIDREEVAQADKESGLPFTQEMHEWNMSGRQTIDSITSFISVAKAHEQLALDMLRFEEIEAEIFLLDQTLLLERIETEIKSSFYKMFAGKFVSEEKIFEDIKRYEARLSDIKADLSQLEGKKATVEARLVVVKKALDNVGQKRQELIDLRERIFKGKPQEYARIQELLNDSEALIKQEIKRLNDIRGLYNDIALKQVKAEQQMRFTIEELRASSRSIIWDRPEDAISWQGLKNSFADIETFLHDIRSYLIHFELSPLLYKIKHIFMSIYNPLYFGLVFLGWLLFLLLLRFMLPRVRDFFYQLAKGRKGIWQALLAGLATDFLLYYFCLLAVWLTIAICFNYYLIPDPYPYIIFYICSIPLLLYLTYRFIQIVVAKNSELGYIFISKEYVDRFISCLSTLLYATIVIFFFRKAFILCNYPKSELPNILKALNIIILQISAIFMLTKEFVLSFIPRVNDMWQWIRDKVDHYYYGILALLITIIVMMNRYVGFGRLVFFILSNVLYTLLLVGALFWLHGLVKRWSSSFFFYSEQEVVKERFPSAKTWYGVSIIAILLTFIFLGAIAAAKIWQWPEKLNTIREFNDVLLWLKTPLLLSHTESPISVYSILQFLFFVLAGFLASVGIRKFVLSRIFDVLLIDSGVQNTVNSLMRYMVMVIAIFLGLNAVGLGTQINVMLGALLVGIGFIIKDPAADFFAYFVILVQRPIKIGDYIKINEEVMGVVRKITPRSVVLRRKNSTMIIIPNSYVTNNPIVNWNYIRGFIAFNDITVVVSYKDDPIKAKEIFERVLDMSPYILKNPKPVIRLENFGVNGYEFIVRGYISSNYTLDQWNIASEVRLQIVKALQEHKMHPALPIRLMVNYQDREQDYTQARDRFEDRADE